MQPNQGGTALLQAPLCTIVQGCFLLSKRGLGHRAVRPEKKVGRGGGHCPRAGVLFCILANKEEDLIVNIKTYNPDEIELKWQKNWADAHAFEAKSDKSKPSSSA